MMRRLGLFVVIGLMAGSAEAEIRDVLKSSQIEAMFARTDESLTVHETPTYAVVFRVNKGKDSADGINTSADEIWFVRGGAAELTIRDKHYQIGAGDVVNLPRNTAYQVDPKGGRVAYVAVRVFPAGAHRDRSLVDPTPMDDVLKGAVRDAVFADNDTNQPLHSVRNLSVNYVIYKGRPGPWEAHRGCVDIYFVHTGGGIAHLGGEITDPAEEAPGEIRGTGVTGARKHEIGPGDIVLIPHNTAHYMLPTAEKLGYNLVKVWAQE